MCVYVRTFLLNMFLEVESLGCRVCVETAKQLSKWLLQFTLPPAMDEASPVAQE